MILGEKKNSAKFDGKWPKIRPTCIFRRGKSLDGLKRNFFWGGEIDSAKFSGKWPKIWPTCIFRPGKSLDGL